MAGAGRGAKRARKSDADAEKGMSALLDSTTNKDLEYIIENVKDKPEIAAFISSLIRDGEIQRAFEAKKEKMRAESIGRKIPARTEKFKLLPKTFCEEFVESFLGRQITDPEDPLTPEAWRRILCFGLRVTGDTQLPAAHKNKDYEGPMKSVLQARARGVGMANRMAAHTTANAPTFGNYALNPEDTSKVYCRFEDVYLTLPFGAEYFEEGNTWTIKDNDSVFEATICCEEAGTNQKLWYLFAAQHNPDSVTPDTEWSEYPNAADHFGDDSAGSARDVANDTTVAAGGAAVTLGGGAGVPQGVLQAVNPPRTT